MISANTEGLSANKGHFSGVRTAKFVVTILVVFSDDWGLYVVVVCPFQPYSSLFQVLLV